MTNSRDKAVATNSYPTFAEVHGPGHLNFTVSDAAYKKAEEYRLLILNHKNSTPPITGNQLTNVLNKQQKSLDQMSTEEFLKCIINSKKPKCFAEDPYERIYDYWNATEQELLCSVGVVAETYVFSDGDRNNPKTLSQTEPCLMLFVSSPLLTNDAVDQRGIIKNGVIDDNAYLSFFVDRVLPLLRQASEQAKSYGKKLDLTIPGLGCGQFAGKASGKVQQHLYQALEKLLETYGNELDGIDSIYFNPYEKENLTDNQIIDTPKQIGHITFTCRDKSDNRKAFDLSKENQNNPGIMRACFVAADWASLPGNDMWIDSRTTDEGVKAAESTILATIASQGLDKALTDDQIKKTYSYSNNKHKYECNDKNWTKISTSLPPLANQHTEVKNKGDCVLDSRYAKKDSPAVTENEPTMSIKKQIDELTTSTMDDYDSLNQLIIQHDLSDKRIVGDASTATWNIGCGTNWVDKVPELKDASSTPEDSQRQRGCSSKGNKVSPFSERERLNLCAYIIERLLHRVDAVLVQEGPSKRYLQNHNISEDEACSLFGVPANGERGQIKCWTKSKNGENTLNVVNKDGPRVNPQSPVEMILEAAKNARLDEKEYQITTSGSKIYVNIHFDWAKMYKKENNQKSELTGLKARIDFLKNIQQYADVIGGDTNIEATVKREGGITDPISEVHGLHVANGGCISLDLFCRKNDPHAELLSVNPTYYSQQPLANIDNNSSTAEQLSKKNNNDSILNNQDTSQLTTKTKTTEKKGVALDKTDHQTTLISSTPPTLSAQSANNISDKNSNDSIHGNQLITEQNVGARRGTFTSSITPTNQATLLNAVPSTNYGNKSIANDRANTVTSRSATGTIISCNLSNAPRSTPNASLSTPAHSNRSSQLQNIYIYAPPEQQTSSTKLPYARTPYKLTAEEKNTLLVGKEGLTLRAPEGMPYQFSYANGTPTAKIGPQANNVDKNTLAITIISMIDNVLAKGEVVNVDTDNPMIAQIADSYFKHLNTNKNIETKSFTIKHNGQIYTPSSSTVDVALQALMTKIDIAESTSAENSWANEIKKTPAEKVRQFREILNTHRPPAKSPSRENDSNATDHYQPSN